MLKRRVPRVLATGFLLAVAVSGLSACRTSPTVAAYVGDERVTVTELESAIDERRADPEVDAFAEASPDDFSRQVLDLLVQQEVYTVAAERYGVDVDGDDVRTRVDELLGEDDPDAVFGALAAQGVGRADVFENVRQQLVRQEIAVGEGQAEGLTEEGLRAAYEEASQNAGLRLGYITTPDQATATEVLAQLTADRSRYAALAARYAGDYTLAVVEERSPDQVPAPLAEQIAAAKPGTGFTLALPEVGGVIVGFVDVYPPFEEARPQLEQQAADEAAQAGTALVEEVRGDLGVTLNPRFVEEGELVPGENAVVDLLEEEGAAGEGAAGEGAAGDGAAGGPDPSGN